VQPCHSRRFLGTGILLLLIIFPAGRCGTLRAQVPAKVDPDPARAAAIADFTEKMKAANYPALFDKAAQEFNVPADILKAVAFAETRWEHLTWPPGETVSPENGMPRPFGIMSLWDNPYFGHSLVEAAKLIGKDPEELKQDAFQNIRGGAALLRKIYDETPRPDGSSEAEIESWRFAIRKYTGIPEPDLNAGHALKVYTFMNQGFHDFGIEWQGHPVKLEPLQKETQAIVEDERRKKEAAVAVANAERQTQAAISSMPKPPTTVQTQAKITNSSPEESKAAAGTSRKNRLWWMLAAIAFVLACRLLLMRKRKS